MSYSGLGTRTGLWTRHRPGLSPPGLCTRCSRHPEHPLLSPELLLSLTNTTQAVSPPGSPPSLTLVGLRCLPESPGLQAPQCPTRLPPGAPSLWGPVI